MIQFNLRLENPFSDRWEILVSKSRVFEKKAVEFNIYKSNIIAEMSIEASAKKDHAGLRLSLGLVGYELEFHFYDTRHWDRENNCWELYNQYKKPMGNQTDYFNKIGYKPKYHIGDRVFGRYGKIPFIGTVGNDTVISLDEGPRISIFLDLPMKVDNIYRSVIIVKHKDIKPLKEF